MCILDDGIGMTPNDFQNKFLKIGYTKRKNKQYKSQLEGPISAEKVSENLRYCLVLSASISQLKQQARRLLAVSLIIPD